MFSLHCFSYLQIAKMSIQKNSISEFTQIVLVETEILNKQQVRGKNDPKKADDQNAVKIIVLRSHGIGFGNLTATMENIPPGSSETKPIETAEIIAKAASNCCGRLCDICCCMCCIRVVGAPFAFPLVAVFVLWNFCFSGVYFIGVY
ncbi:hypothetical protein M9H77_14598 [Catharanthus roseus]|uniref:Uncharacterized protein n=1 Tax=Catharanthus roseus TaxID=4058 RepID=A0ACC0BNN7_CATRO|nr:hypothetical protein M9H77_14598 [Catharanthus roseus]